ncbi:hypothetical protein [Paraburkholderia ferrariae]|uniref:Transcriptional regulator n=1 Tax=Paraburkholderia ferrariae TaxID=386056 RepID=A0ABU9RYE3_9BURK
MSEPRNRWREQALAEWHARQGPQAAEFDDDELQKAMAEWIERWDAQQEGCAVEKE